MFICDERLINYDPFLPELIKKTEFIKKPSYMSGSHLAFRLLFMKTKARFEQSFLRKGVRFWSSDRVRSVNSILIIRNFVTDDNFMQIVEEYVNICCDLNWLQFFLSTIIFRWKSHSSGPVAVGAHVSLAGEVSAWVSSYEGEDPAWILP